MSAPVRSEAASAVPVVSGRGFRLRIVEGAAEIGREYHADSSCTIGRGEDCQIVLPDPSVSRRHAKLERTADGYRLTDTGSANGTWVGDRRIQEIQLDHLDRFRVGGTVLEFFRDDDPEADDLEMVKTTALPIKELLESIQIALVTRLEDEGEPLLVSGNQPILLADPSRLWLVETGKVEIFTVAVRDGHPSGARTHFVTLGPGEFFFGMDLALYGMGSGLLAVGKTGTKLRQIAVSRLQELAAEGKQTERIASLVDTWVGALSRSVIRDILPGPPSDVDLSEKQAASLDYQKRARSTKGVLWVPVESGDLLFLGMSEVAFEADSALFPVGPDAWVESAVAGLSVEPVASEGVLARPEFWRGLEAFHQALSECEFLNKKLATVDEFNRLKSKAQYSQAAREAAYEDIGAVLESPGAKRKESAPTGEIEPVYQACRDIGEAMGMSVKKPPESKAERSFEENLAAIAMASRFRTRQVALRADWWNRDQGPILGQIEATKAPVALIPRGPRSYEWSDPATGKRSPVTEEFAETLNPFAYVLYRPFPDGALRAVQLVRFGVRGLKKDVVTLITMGVAMGLLGSLTPYFTGRLFDTAIPQADRGLLTQFTVALFISALTSSAFKITQSIAVLRIQGKMDYSIQAALWDRLLDLPSTFFKKFSAGDLADRAGGIDAIRSLLAGAGVSAILGSLSSVFYVMLMLTYSIPLALLAILLTILYVGFTTAANYLQLRYQREQLRLRGKITGLVVQLISGVAKLRVSGAEHHGFRVWAHEFADQRRLAFRVGQIQNAAAVFNAGFPVFSSMAIFATLVYVQSAAAAAGKTSTLTTGDFIGFSAAYGLFLAAMQAMGEASLSLLKAVPIYERLTPILTTPPEIDDTKAPPGQLKGEIEISHVHFRYSEDGPWILKDLSLKISPGEFIAFVGSSGSGKSTLMRLMLGFERAEKGSIYYDGQDLSSLDLRMVRQQLGVVLQDSRVLPADIFRNIVGTTSRTIEEAWDAAEMAGLAEDIRQMPMGMHTYVSEAGGGFSGGQKQRLLIARGVVNKPRIVFLDEATSALDNRTQAIVTASLDKMRATRIVIAHRLSTVINADRICYLEQGTLKEVGTHDELMKKNGLFAELARRQMA